MLKNETKESLIAKLQAYRQQANHNRNFGGAKKDSKRRPYFRNHSPEVQAECWRQLSSLCIKHKARLEADPLFVKVLYPTAASLALEKLGLNQKSRKGFRRMREMNRIKVDLGIQDKSLVRRYTPKRKVNDATSTSNVQKCSVTMASLEGI